MKKNISTHAIQPELLNDLLILAELKRCDFKDEGAHDIPVDTIKEICASVADCTVNELKSHPIGKELLLFGATLFSNEHGHLLAKKINRYMHKTIRGHLSGIWEINKNYKHAGLYLRLLEKLLAICPERIAKLAGFDFTDIKGVEDGNSYLPTENVSEFIDIETIPERTKPWFYNNNNKYSMFAFTPGSNDVKLITYSRTSDFEIFYLLQLKGIRFLSFLELSERFVDFIKKSTESMLQRNSQIMSALKPSMNDAVKKKYDRIEGRKETERILTYEDMISLAFDIDADEAFAGLAVAALTNARNRFKEVSRYSFRLVEGPSARIEVIGN